MTPEEKQSELDRHRIIVLAAIDYFIKRSRGINYGEPGPTTNYEHLKKRAEDHYQKNRLSQLKQWLLDLTEEFRETGDLAFDQYIKEKTGYDLDIFGSFQDRIGKVIKRKRIKTENEYRDVLAMVDNLCQQMPVDQDKIDVLNSLLIDFDERVSGTKTPKDKRTSSGKTNYFIKEVSESYSPDNKRKVTIIESGRNENHASTQVAIQFGQSGAGVYAANGVNLGIKAYWKNNNTILVETRKDYLVLQKWEQVQSFQDIVIVEYIEA